MEINGVIVAVLPIQTGEGKNGTWKKQTAVLETDGQYPKKVAFDMFGDKIKDLSVGDKVVAGIDIDSREYNGKWYTNIGAWKVEVTEAVNTPEPEKKWTPEPPASNQDEMPF